MSQSPHFQQLLHAATAQSEPQRLLFVFASAGLPESSTPKQREELAAGRGGALTPLMCVDKAPADLTGFDTLVAESRRAGPPWQVVFAASLAGNDGRPPTPARIDAALEKMVSAVLLGGVGAYAAFAASGEPLQFDNVLSYPKV